MTLVYWRRKIFFVKKNTKKKNTKNKKKEWGKKRETKVQAYN
jgi:hypothetical protein